MNRNLSLEEGLSGYGLVRGSYDLVSNKGDVFNAPDPGKMDIQLSKDQNGVSYFKTKLLNENDKTRYYSITMDLIKGVEGFALFKNTHINGEVKYDIFDLSLNLDQSIVAQNLYTSSPVSQLLPNEILESEVFIFQEGSNQVVDIGRSIFNEAFAQSGSGATGSIINIREGLSFINIGPLEDALGRGNGKTVTNLPTGLFPLYLNENFRSKYLINPFISDNVDLESPILINICDTSFLNCKSLPLSSEGNFSYKSGDVNIGDRYLTACIDKTSLKGALLGNPCLRLTRGRSQRRSDHYFNNIISASGNLILDIGKTTGAFYQDTVAGGARYGLRDGGNGGEISDGGDDWINIDYVNEISSLTRLIAKYPVFDENSQKVRYGTFPLRIDDINHIGASGSGSGTGHTNHLNGTGIDARFNDLNEISFSDIGQGVNSSVLNSYYDGANLAGVISQSDFNIGKILVSSFLLNSNIAGSLQADASSFENSGHYSSLFFSVLTPAEKVIFSSCGDGGEIISNYILDQRDHSNHFHVQLIKEKDKDDIRRFRDEVLSYNISSDAFSISMKWEDHNIKFSFNAPEDIPQKAVELRLFASKELENISKDGASIKLEKEFQSDIFEREILSLGSFSVNSGINEFEIDDEFLYKQIAMGGFSFSGYLVFQDGKKKENEVISNETNYYQYCKKFIVSDVQFDITPQPYSNLNLVDVAESLFGSVGHLTNYKNKLIIEKTEKTGNMHPSDSLVTFKAPSNDAGYMSSKIRRSAAGEGRLSLEDVCDKEDSTTCTIDDLNKAFRLEGSIGEFDYLEGVHENVSDLQEEFQPHSSNKILYYGRDFLGRGVAIAEFDIFVRNIFSPPTDCQFINKCEVTQRPGETEWIVVHAPSNNFSVECTNGNHKGYGLKFNSNDGSYDLNVLDFKNVEHFIDKKVCDKVPYF
ncbi:hypothetical protein OAT67_02535 [Bacteriovoracaceae bacterium]|nr:hypothetical protein [Bacteriovoracaceae bacterium]